MVCFAHWSAIDSGLRRSSSPKYGRPAGEEDPGPRLALQQIPYDAQRHRQRHERFAHPRPTRGAALLADYRRRFRRARQQPPHRQPREPANRPANRQPRNDDAHQPADDEAPRRDVQREKWRAHGRDPPRPQPGNDQPRVRDAHCKPDRRSDRRHEQSLARKHPRDLPRAQSHRAERAELLCPLLDCPA